MNNALITTGTAVCRVVGQFTNKNIEIDKATLPPLEAMSQFAKMHNIQTMLYAGLKRCGFADDELGDLPDTAETLSFCQIKNDAFAARLSANFSNAGIEHMILKGIEFSKYYPCELLRTSTDIDFYMTDKDAERVAKNLESHGFERIEDDENGISLVKKPYAHIELHSHFDAMTKEQAQFFSDMIKNSPYKCSCRKSFDDEGNIFLALLHLYKHFSHSGAGVRMLLDINIMLKKGKFDRDDFKKKLTELKLEQFFNSVCEISGYLFDGKELDKRLLPALEFFLNSGSFGTNTTYLAVNAAKYNGKTSKMTNYLKSEIGFTNKNIQNKYPLAKKYPVLIPYFHIHRVVSGLVHKKDVICRVKNDSKVVTSNDGENRLIEVMDVMGIKIKE